MRASDQRQNEAVAVQDPNPTARAMSTDAHEELFAVLLATAEECPLPVLGDCIELLSTVVARRLHEEIGEIYVDPARFPDLVEKFTQPWPQCDSIWHVTTPREPNCTKCGATE